MFGDEGRQYYSGYNYHIPHGGVLPNVIIAEKIKESDLYNMIMGSEITDAEMIEGESGQSNFPLSRFLEPTPSSVTELLMPVTNSSLKALECSPVLYVSELNSREVVGGSNIWFPYIDIKIGVISKLWTANKAIYFEYTLTKDFGSRDVKSERALKEALDVSDSSFGLTRTHWSIKNERLEDVLAQINQGLDSPIPVAFDEVIAQNTLAETEVIKEVNIQIFNIMRVRSSM